MRLKYCTAYAKYQGNDLSIFVPSKNLNIGRQVQVDHSISIKLLTHKYTYVQIFNIDKEVGKELLSQTRHSMTVFLCDGDSSIFLFL